MQRNDRSYKDLKQKQKSAIADKTYKMHLKFYLENQRMPDATEMNDICKSLFTAVQSLAPKTEYEEFYKIVEKREKSYEERILRDIQNGITFGGAPYGVTWEEMGLKPWEDLEENN